MSEDSAPIGLSERAAQRITSLLAQEASAGAKLRVTVSGGGCSGFQYSFSLDDKVEDDDVVVERDGATLVVDNISLMFLAGAEVDFVEELAGSYFTLNNPNAVSSCGCGSSFAVA